MVDITVNVNGATYAGSVEARATLSDFLRDDLDLTGTHVGCEHGVCGACTVIVDGRAVRSCLMLAVQAAGSEVTTVEGLAPDGALGALQQAMAGLAQLPVRVLHAGVRHAGHRVPRRPPGRRTSRRSGRRCPATSAAAPATRASSTASCWPRGAAGKPDQA